MNQLSWPRIGRVLGFVFVLALNFVVLGAVGVFLAFFGSEYLLIHITSSTARDPKPGLMRADVHAAIVSATWVWGVYSLLPIFVMLFVNFVLLEALKIRRLWRWNATFLGAGWLMMAAFFALTLRGLWESYGANLPM